MAESNNVKNLLGVSIEKIREAVDTSTVIGDPITAPNGTTVIPVSKISYGFASGGSDLPAKNADSLFGGGAGAGVNITPVAFLVVRGESVRMLPVAEPASTSMDRLIEQLPDLLDKAESLMKQKRLAKEEGIE